MDIKLPHFFFGPLLRFGISRNLQATALWTMLESFSSPLFSILLIPILTHSLGFEKYGLYVMVMAFVSFFGFTGLGMNTSITYYLAADYERSSPKEVAERISSALILTILGTVVFSCIFLYSSQLQLKAYSPQFIDQKKLIYVSLSLIIITQLDMVISASLKGLQQYKMSSKVEFVLRLLGFLIVTLVATIEKSVLAITFSFLIMALFNLIVRYCALNKIVNLHIGDFRISRCRINELFRFGKWMTLQSIASAFFGSIDKLVIGSLLGAKILGIYNVLLSITQLIHYVPANMLTFILPKVANSCENISMTIVKKIFIVNVIITFSLVILILTFTGYIFSRFHIDHSYEPLFYWLVISYILLSFNTPFYFIALGLNLIKAVSLQCVIGAILGIASLLLLISEYGLMGAVASKIIYAVIAIFLVVPVLKKMNLS